MKAAFGAILAAVALTGCVTVGSRLKGDPKLVATTEKPLAEFQTCFADLTDRKGETPAYTPRGNVSTYSYGVGTYTAWVVRVTDEGASRRVELFETRSLMNNQRFANEIRGCL